MTLMLAERSFLEWDLGWRLADNSSATPVAQKHSVGGIFTCNSSFMTDLCMNRSSCVLGSVNLDKAHIDSRAPSCLSRSQLMELDLRVNGLCLYFVPSESWALSFQGLFIRTVVIAKCRMSHKLRPMSTTSNPRRTRVMKASLALCLRSGQIIA